MAHGCHQVYAEVDDAGMKTSCDACRVAGALASLGVRQVECGLNLTVALTVDGRAWQMGETGAPADRRMPWEHAYVPVQAGAHLGDHSNPPSEQSRDVCQQSPLFTALLSHLFCTASRDARRCTWCV